MSDSKKKAGGKSPAGNKAPQAGSPEEGRGGAAAKAACSRPPAKAGKAAASPAEKPRLAVVYAETIRPKLVEEFGYKNPMEVPKLRRSSSTWAWAKRRATRRSSTRRSRT